MEKKASWVQTGLFLAFIAVFAVLHLVIPDIEFSERENRYLQQLPDFSFKSLFSGKYTSEFESYTTDQFAFRDGWTTLKARSELAAGKKENNEIYLCRPAASTGEDILIERFSAPPTETLDDNLAALEKLKSNVSVPVYLALIPGAAEIWQDRLPENAPCDSQKDIVDYVYARTSLQTVDMFGALSPHAGENIYYRTDHHWTGLGAYYGYTALMSAMGLPATPVSRYEEEVISTDFYGSLFSSSGFSWVKPDTMSIFVREPAGLTVTNYPYGKPVSARLYDESFLQKKDKYSYYLGGSTPLVRIETENKDAPSLLILRDSFFDSLAPFLLEDFSELHILDLRYYRTSLAAYMEENEVDCILVCYSVENFCSDANIPLLGR